MNSFIVVLLVLASVGCATQQYKPVWRVKDFVLSPVPEIALENLAGETVITVPTRTMHEMLLAHIRISRTANVQSELYLAEGDDPNAFVGLDVTGRNVMGINLGMVRLAGDDASVYAALIGHESAHLAKDHSASRRVRSNTIKLIGTMIGAGLGIGGVPGGTLISDLGVDVVISAYTRDQEREADALGLEYMLANRYDPSGAIRLYELLLNASSGFRIPFLATHPSSDERIENLRALIEAKKSQDELKPTAPSTKNIVAKE